MKKLFIISSILFFQLYVSGQNCNFEGYYLTQSSQGDKPFWLPDQWEAQGIGNDGENWLITTTEFASQWSEEVLNGRLWKIPKSVPLNTGGAIPSNVDFVSMDNIPALNSDDYDHWGDPDHYSYAGTDYILVPIYDSDDGGEKGIIACFRASDLVFRSYSIIDERPGWIAVDNDGRIYTKKAADKLVRYEVDWEKLTSNTSQTNAISNPQVISLNFPDPDYDALEHWQGGEFSESGELLYISSGAAGGCVPFPGSGCGLFSQKAGPGEPHPSDGIHVFDTQSWTEIETSMNTSSGNVHFSFPFDNDITGEQPQGLTIWDLEDGSAASPATGSLHVLLFDFNFSVTDPGNHKVKIVHFSNILRVDAANGEIPPFSERLGTLEYPFKTFHDAFFHYPIWDGAEIRLKAGEYSDTGTYDKKVRITSEGGPAIIGQQ